MTNTTENISKLLNENAKLLVDLRQKFIVHAAVNPQIKEILVKINTLEKNENEMKIDLKVVNGYIEGLLNK